MYARPLADPIRLMIRTDQVEEAVELLKNVQLSFTGIKLDKKTMISKYYQIPSFYSTGENYIIGKCPNISANR